MSEAAPKKTCSRSGCIAELRQKLATYQIQKAAQEIVLTPSRLDLCWPTHVPCRVVAEAGQGWPRLVENGTSLHELKLVFKRDFAEAKAPPVLWPRQAGEEKGLRSLAVLELHGAPRWFPIRGPSVRSLALIDCGDQELNGTTVRSIGCIDLSVYTELKELRLIRTAAQIILPPLCRLTRLAITLGKCNDLAFRKKKVVSPICEPFPQHGLDLFLEPFLEELQELEIYFDWPNQGSYRGPIRCGNLPSGTQASLKRLRLCSAFRHEDDLVRRRKLPQSVHSCLTDALQNPDVPSEATRPRLVLNVPFDLTEERRIPAQIWDEIDAEGLPFDIIGAPPAAVGSRGKKRPTTGGTVTGMRHAFYTNEWYRDSDLPLLYPTCLNFHQIGGRATDGHSGRGRGRLIQPTGPGGSASADQPPSLTVG
eukprot:g80637.t1